ncbi:substrate-binding periplasmic protein [Ideonella paludis]|uniref:Transporter substrate-binding domain-containing protein n=1 Tax=Ideonella paludis TaxID=1233411 RepID=A0ABS5E2S3_9BURK|nr:transporter substrate-binding domain-containing protein [Ideonella paludis]MBQ0937672.1 transporter substrate-binding domain-containing protein [Ideonella paludis]
MSQIQRRHVLGGGAALALGGLLPAAGAQTASGPTPTLDKLRASGRLSVAVYNDLPPFHVAGKGIEVDMAEALAQALGLKLSLLPFNADENMNDDLRNLVWRGHYLGFGPADVMLHVPVDRPLMEANKRVQIFAPYYRERVMVARRLADVPQMDSLEAFKGKKIAVPGQTLAGWLLIGADGGAYREQLVTKLKDGVEAAQALQRGEVAAAAGHASELESVLAGDDRYAIEPLPVPRMKEGWAVGCAVKAEAVDLAQALQAAMNGLASSGKLAEIFAKSRVKWRPV